MCTIVMVCPINVKAEEAEKAIQKAIAGIKDGTYCKVLSLTRVLGSRFRV